ncbi:hypothetical protein I2800192A2_20860 [Anaerostipes hadrus]|uniref:C39 family peptidase n=1 Tax=Anaerostipes hadrus TaxID=649756 RepID=UPI0034A85FB5
MKKKRFKKICHQIAAIAMAILMVPNTQVFAQIAVDGVKKIDEKNWFKTNEKEFSSFDDSKALKVDAEYGFRLYRTKNSTFTVEEGKSCKYPTSYNGLDLNIQDFEKEYLWFKTSENSVDKIKVKISNMEIYQCDADGSNGHWVKVDMVRTVTGIEKYKGQDGYIALGENLTNTVYVGLEEVKTTSTFYKAGTTTKVSLKSNVTLKDIDSNQYIGVKANKVTISKKHKKDKTSSRRKRPKSKERYKKKKIAEKNVDSKNEIIKKQKNQKEYIGDYIYFNQTDSIWNNNNLSLRSAGCGPTAVAVCISNLTHKFVSPVTVAGWAKKEGYYSSSGSLHSAIPAMASHWNLQCRGLYKNEKEIERALRSGHMVVGLMGPGYFTNGGHFISLLTINKKGMVEVADVGSRVRSQKTYDLAFIIQNSKIADAGGPFWEIWSNKTDGNNNKKQKRKNKVHNKVIKQSDDQKKNKEEIIRKFYLNLQIDLTDFEKEIPMDELLIGIKSQGIQDHKSKINNHLKELGNQLNDEKIVQVSETYSFGMDAMQLHKERTYFAVPTYLENITRIN